MTSAERVTLQCSVCGEEFTRRKVYADQIKRDRERKGLPGDVWICSEECKAEHARATNKGWRKVRGISHMPFLLPCALCGKWFVRAAGRCASITSRQNANQFCTPEHQRKFIGLSRTPEFRKRFLRETATRKTCQQCGKVFAMARADYWYKYRDRMRRGTSVSRNWYCGQECRRAAMVGCGVYPDGPGTKTVLVPNK